MLNRRAHRRTRVDRRVEVVPLETGRRKRRLFGADKPPSPAAGKLVDICVGGLAAEVSATLEVGTQVDIHIEGASGRMQRARGIVRNVRGDNGTRTLGIAFTEPVLALGDPGRDAPPLGPAGIEPFALVIDDDPGVRHVLERFLEKRGLRVTAVPSAEDGLERLRKEEAALVMLDLRMDGMTGVQLLEQMKAEGLRATNVWAMSGIADDDEALAALALGASEFVNKPFDLDHLDYCLQLVAPLL